MSHCDLGLCTFENFTCRALLGMVGMVGYMVVEYTWMGGRQ